MIYDNENAIGLTLPKCILNLSCQFTSQFISVLNTRSNNEYRGRRKSIPARSKINDSCEIMAADKLNITLAYIATDYGKNQITTEHPEIVNHGCYIHGTLQMPLWHAANCMRQGDKRVPPIHSQSHYKCLKQVVTLEVQRDFGRCRRPFQICQAIKHTRNVSIIPSSLRLWMFWQLKVMEHLQAHLFFLSFDIKAQFKRNETCVNLKNV